VGARINRTSSTEPEVVFEAERSVGGSHQHDASFAQGGIHMHRTQAFSALRGWQVRCALVALLLLVGGSELANGSPGDAAANGTAPSGVDSGSHEATRPEPPETLGGRSRLDSDSPVPGSNDARAGRIDLTKRQLESHPVQLGGRSGTPKPPRADHRGRDSSCRFVRSIRPARASLETWHRGI